MKLLLGKVLLRLREFYQAEIEVFCNPKKLDELEKFSEVENTIHYEFRISDEKIEVH